MKPNSTFVLIKRRSPLAAPPPPQGHPGQAKTLRNAAPAHSPAAVTCLLSHCWIPAALWSRNISPVHGASPAAKANTPLTGQHTPFVKQTHGHIDFVCVQKKKPTNYLQIARAECASCAEIRRVVLAGGALLTQKQKQLILEVV